jgi:hypothetical protein
MLNTFGDGGNNMFKGRLVERTAVLVSLAVMSLMVSCNRTTTPAGSADAPGEQSSTKGTLSTNESVQVTTCSGLKCTVLESEVYRGADLPQSPIPEGLPQPRIPEGRDRHTFSAERDSSSDRTSQDWFNAAGWMNTALADSGVLSEMALRESEGYHFAREYSFVYHGRVVIDSTSDTVSIVAVHLVMPYTQNVNEKLAQVIFTFSTELGQVVQSSLMNFVDPLNDTYNHIVFETLVGEQELWVKDLPPYGLGESGRWWDWNRYMLCCISRIIEYGAYIAIGAILFGPLAPEELTLAGSAIALGCAFEQVMSHYMS